MNDPRKQHEQDRRADEAAAAAAADREQDADQDAAAAAEDDPAMADADAAADAAAPAPEPTAEERLAAECDELRDKWLRALADLDNQRKRARRDVDDARRFALAEVLRPMLEVADNFERALQAMDGSEETTAAGVRQGVDLIHQSFRAALRDRGVEPIEAMGQPFDPARHEAVAQVPGGDAEAGTVIDIVQQGYRLGEFVLRPARVVIAS
ncbi:MAG: nucleotide exchange factor GrpE [Candidatus Krumholzibacteriia bacterium]